MILNDIRYILKRIIIGVGIAICLMFLKGGLIGNVYALEHLPNQLLYLTSNENVLYSSNQVQNNSASIAGVRKVRLNYNNYALIQNGVYSLTLRIQYIQGPATDGVMTGSAVGYYITNNSISAQVNEQYQYGSYYYRDLTVTYNFTSTRNSSSFYWQGQFDSDRRFNSFNVVSSDLQFLGNSYDNTDIINNNNQNTQNIINNDNQNTQNIIESNKDTKKSIDDQTNVIKNEDISGANNKLNEFINNDAFKDSTGLDSIIKLPLDFLSRLGNTCEPLNLNVPYLNIDLNIPCISTIISSKVPTIYYLLRIVINGFILYRLLIELYFIIKNAKDPNNDRIEVLEL